MIIDNILPEKKFKDLSDEVLSSNFPWFFCRKPPLHVTGENFYLNGWGNQVLNVRGEVLYDPNDTLIKAARSVLLLAGESVQDLLRIRLILNTAAPKSYENGVHVDLSFEHRTALLYFNDSDGDTLLCKEQYDPSSNKNPSEFFIEDLKQCTTPLASVTPKANRLFIFNGLNYHSGTLPTTVPNRVVMNINYQVKGMKRL